MASYKHKSDVQKRSEKGKSDQATKKNAHTLFEVGVKKATKERRQKEHAEDAHTRPQRDHEVEALDAGSNVDAEVDAEGNVTIDNA